MDNDALKAELVRDEGCVLHAYQDSRGFWTIGVGRLVDARAAGRITHSEAMVLLEHDIADLARQLADRLPYWQQLDGVRQRALANMAFQLGVGGLLGFKHMLAALAQQDWVRARTACLDSAYAVQTPARAARIAGMLATGSAPSC